MNNLYYLYIATFQNDNYSFYNLNGNFDIWDKLNKLDSLLC